MLSDGWALTADENQWMLCRARGKAGKWQPISFIGSNKRVLRRLLRESGVNLSTEAEDAVNGVNALPTISCPGGSPFNERDIRKAKCPRALFRQAVRECPQDALPTYGCAVGAANPRITPQSIRPRIVIPDRCEAAHSL